LDNYQELSAVLQGSV